LAQPKPKKLHRKQNESQQTNGESGGENRIHDFGSCTSGGRDSRDNFFLSAKDESENVLGFAWYSVAAEDPARAYIFDLIVEDRYRGRGYGRQIMLLLEAEMKKRGVRRVGLNVFNFNMGAIRLYESMAYATTNRQMEKVLSE
jgi:ribosomal protein S18 acetylase RimI-like enzyme